jgi:iron complex outermembrane receptor protein
MLRFALALILFNHCVLFLCQNGDTLKTFDKTVGVSNRIELPSQMNSKVFNDSMVKRYENKDLSAFLTIENSVYIKTYGMGGIASLSKRGASSGQTQLQWNGIPINSSTLGMQDLSLLPILFVDNITIASGSSPNGGLEGAVNLRNSVDFTKKTNIAYTKEWGSFGLDKTSIKGCYGSKKWRASTALFKHTALNDFTFQDYSMQDKPIVKRTNAEIKGWGISQNVYTEYKKWQVSWLSNYVHYHRQIPAAIGVLGNAPFQLDESIKTAFRIKLRTKTVQQLQVGYVADNMTYIDSVSQVFSTIQTTLLSGQYELERFTIFKTISGFGSANFFHAKAMSSGFSSDRMQNRILAQVGVEQRSAKYKIQLLLRQEVIANQAAPIMPSVHVSKWMKNDQLVMLGQVYSNYRYPTLNDLYWNPGGNENLLPEKNIGGEVGVDVKSKSDAVSAYYFYSITDNWIQWLPTNLGYWTAQNIKSVERQGLEVNARKKINLNHFQQIVLSGNYTYVSAINKKVDLQNDAIAGKQLMYVPHHTIGLSANYCIKKMEVTYHQHIYSRTYIDATNTTYLPYVAPASLQIGGTLMDKNVDAYFALKIENLFNEAYQIIANQPLPGRFFSVIFRLTLKQ